MSKIGKFFAVLIRGRVNGRRDADLSADFEAAQERLNTAQADFNSVVRELLVQNERLRSRNVRSEKPS